MMVHLHDTAELMSDMHVLAVIPGRFQTYRLQVLQW